ncbi:MAG: hypothetical protein HC884_12690 [Chloroflexaceae bacterium]|nr:hypothetical protein [Chloroflexaceae bacterium]
MTTQNLGEAWFRLMSEAMRGSGYAQEAVRALTSSTTSMTDLSRWMTQFLPAGVNTPAQTELFGEWLEQWWKLMGVVPRHRYLELLERHENLRLRLEECEKARKVTGSMNLQDAQEETRKVMDLWGTMLDSMLKTQSEMMQNFFPGRENPAEGSRGELPERAGSGGSENAS